MFAGYKRRPITLWFLFLYTILIGNIASRLFVCVCVYHSAPCLDHYSSVWVPRVVEELKDARLHCSSLLPLEREWTGSCSLPHQGHSVSSLEAIGSLVVHHLGERTRFQLREGQSGHLLLKYILGSAEDWLLRLWEPISVFHRMFMQCWLL